MGSEMCIRDRPPAPPHPLPPPPPPPPGTPQCQKPCGGGVCLDVLVESLPCSVLLSSFGCDCSGCCYDIQKGSRPRAILQDPPPPPPPPPPPASSCSNICGGHTCGSAGGSFTCEDLSYIGCNCAGCCTPAATRFPEALVQRRPLPPSPSPPPPPPPTRLSSLLTWGGGPMPQDPMLDGGPMTPFKLRASEAVSYTHLTLPTICSV